MCGIAAPKRARLQLDGPGTERERSTWDSQPAPFPVLFMWEVVSFYFDSCFLISGIESASPEIFILQFFYLFPDILLSSFLPSLVNRTQGKLSIFCSF